MIPGYIPKGSSFKLRKEWVDVEDVEVLVGDQRMGRGCLPRNDRLGANSPVFEDKFDIIPRDAWVDLIRAQGVMYRNLVKRIKNQKSEGSCAGNAATAAVQQRRSIQYDPHAAMYSPLLSKRTLIPHPMEISAMSLYCRTGRSGSSGSTIGGNLYELRERGALPEDLPENIAFAKATGAFDPEHCYRATGFGRGERDLPPGWEKTAAYFTIDQYYDIETIEGMFTALFLFGNVVYGRARHSIMGCYPVYEEESRKFFVGYQNSWSGDWGDEGFGFDSEAYLKAQGAVAHGMYSIQVVTYPTWMTYVPTLAA